MLSGLQKQKNEKLNPYLWSDLELLDQWIIVFIPSSLCTLLSLTVMHEIDVILCTVIPKIISIRVVISTWFNFTESTTQTINHSCLFTLFICVTVCNFRDNAHDTRDQFLVKNDVLMASDKFPGLLLAQKIIAHVLLHSYAG